MKNRELGYEEARLIDSQISHLLMERPLERNLEFWLVFCRTVSSGLDPIYRDAKKLAKDLTKNGLQETRATNDKRI